MDRVDHPNRVLTVALGAGALVATGAVSRFMPQPAALAVLVGAGALVVWGLWVRVVQPGRRAEQARRSLADRLAALAAQTGRAGEQSLDDDDGVRAAREGALLAALAARLQTERDAARALREMFDAVAEPVFATGADGVVVASNRAAGEFLGRSVAEIVGRPLEELFTQTDVLALHAVASGGRARQAQVRFARQGGVRVHQVAASPVRVEGGEAGAGAGVGGGGQDAARRPAYGVVLTLRDVTELASAVQLKTDFVANASHELRTPLSSLKGAIETLGDTGPDDEPIRQRLFRMLSENVARLEELTRDLLDLSRLESPDAPREVGPVRAADIPDLLLRDFGAVCAERRLGIAFDLAPGLDSIETDPKLLLLVLKNLVDNATKFAYEGSTVRVVARPLPPASPGARRGVRWEVVDRGVGIPLNAQQRIFERFYQVDASRSGLSHRRGSGLGLAIVKHAVKLLGGTISVSSVWKEGTTMIVELPDCLASVDAPGGEAEAPRAADAAA